MNELGKQIFEARTEERRINNELRKLNDEIQSLEEEVEYAERTLESDLESEKDTYIEENQEVVKEKFQPKREALEEEIAKLESILDSNEVDDTEELLKARETKEYLNSAAVSVNRYYEELKKISTPYFIDLAYNEKRMKLGAFRKTFSRLPDRIRQLEDMRVTLTQPFKFVESMEIKKSANNSIYLSSTLLSWWVALCTPIAVFKAVKRSKFLHDSAQLYHKLMHTLASLKNATDEEISKIFSSLIQLRNQKLKDMLEAKNDELQSLELELEEELRAVVFDEASFLRTGNMKIAQNRMKLESMQEQVVSLEEKLAEVRKLIEQLTGERADSLEVERNSYLSSNDDRKVVVPDKLLFDWKIDSNMFFELTHGLYLFNERATVNSFMKMVIFQLRNIMEWGSIQFKVLDLLGAEVLSPLLLPNTGKAKVQDISIFTLKQEREQIIESMHDLLIRRKMQVLQTVSNLGDYNLLQKASGSSPLSYQIILIVLTDVIKPDEKLIQLIHNGKNVGLLVFIFMKEEFLTIQVAKSIETYVESFIELTDSGLTTFESKQYRIALESREADRKSRI